MVKRWDEMNDHQLKREGLSVLIIGVISGLIIAVMLFFMLKNIFVSICGFLGMFLGTVYFSLVVIKRDWLDEKICLFNPAFQGISYSGIILMLVTLSIALSFVFGAMAFVQGGFYSGIAFAISPYFPAIIMLWRLDVYKDENCRLLLVEDENGNKYYEQVIGYYPVFYYLIGITFARGPLGVSIKYLLESIFLNEGLLSYNIICFIVSLIIGFLILSPDIMNKILPFEMKRINGMLKYGVIAITLIGLNLLMMVTEVYNIIITLF